jgi:predicted dinucleotide-binding enzyme
MYWETLRDEARPTADRDDRFVLLWLGTTKSQKSVVSDLIEEIGFAPVDTGSLAEGGRRQQPESPIYNEPMTPSEARARLADLQDS